MQTQEAVGLLCGYGVYVLVCASFNTVLAAMARRSGGAEGSLLADQSGSSTLANGQIRRFCCSFVGAETTIMILCFVVVMIYASTIIVAIAMAAVSKWSGVGSSRRVRGGRRAAI